MYLAKIYYFNILTVLFLMYIIDRFVTIENNTNRTQWPEDDTELSKHVVTFNHICNRVITCV
jgi:hypothetical protein